MAVNCLGATNAVAALMPRMIARQAWDLAFVASLADYRGLPYAAAYCPSKAAVISLAEALQPDLARLGVKVSVINPGFVETPMTAANKVPMPSIIKSQDAAAHIIAGLQAGKFETAFPWQMVTATKIERILHYSLHF
jgi:short-subunit dehydrogenase